MRKQYKWREFFALIANECPKTDFFIIFFNSRCSLNTLISATASERPQIRTWGHQTSFLPRAPSNLVAPLSKTRNATTELFATAKTSSCANVSSNSSWAEKLGICGWDGGHPGLTVWSLRRGTPKSGYSFKREQQDGGTFI